MFDSHLGSVFRDHSEAAVGLYAVGINLRLAACKASVLPHVLSLWCLQYICLKGLNGYESDGWKRKRRALSG